MVGPSNTSAPPSPSGPALLPPLRLSQHLLVWGWYLSLALWATYPLITNLHTHLPAIPGEAGHDVWQHVWNFWWVQQALVVQPSNPFQTDMIFYPHGTTLWLHSLNLPLAVPALLLLPLIGQTAAYNLITLLALVLAGYSTFLLAHYLIRAALPATPPPSITAGAVVAGAVVLCSPQRLWELRQAHLAAVSDFAIPLLLLTLLWALDRRTWGAAWLVAGVVLIGGLSKWYNLFYAALALLPLLAVRLWAAGRQGSLRDELWQWARLALTSVIVLAPFLIPSLHEARTASFEVPTVRGADLLRLVVTDWRWVLRPVPPEWWEPSAFAGLALLLAAVGVALARRAVALWLVIGLWCFVLALGPTLNFGMREVAFPLPYAALQALPLVELFRVPYRMNAITTMMLAMLAAAGIARLLQRGPRPVAWAGAVGLSLLLLVEAARIPFPQTAAAVSPFYAQLGAEPGAWSIIELPHERMDRQFLEMYAQTYHGKYILTGKTSRDPPRLPHEAIPALARINRGDPRPDIVQLGSATEAQIWQALRPRYLVLHRSRNRQSQHAAAQAILGDLTRVYSDTGLEAYRIEAMAAWLDQQPERVPLPVFVGLDRDWENLEDGASPSRWLLGAQTATILAYTPEPARLTLDLTMYALATDQSIEIWLNGAHVQTLNVTADELRRYSTAALALSAGQSRIELRVLGAGTVPARLGQGDDPRPLAVNVRGVAVRLLAP